MICARCGSEASTWVAGAAVEHRALRENAEWFHADCWGEIADLLAAAATIERFMAGYTGAGDTARRLRKMAERRA